MIQFLTNPAGLYKQTTDFRTGKTATGESHAYGNIVLPFRANAAVTKGQALTFVAPTQTVPMSVKPRVNADLSPLFAGIATETKAAGEVVQVCVWGFCEVAVGAADPVAGDYGVLSATTGIVGTVAQATAIDAAVVSGTVLGFFLSEEDADNLAPFFLNRF
jgi:hypothetical protein